MQMPAEAAAVKAESAVQTQGTTLSLSLSLPAPLLTTVPCAVSTRIEKDASEAALGHPPYLPQVWKGKQISQRRDIICLLQALILRISCELDFLA